MSDEHDGHGNSIAAWVCVGLLTVAFALVCLAVVLLSTPLAIVGVIVGIVGVVAGKVLANMGYGVAGQSGSAGH